MAMENELLNNYATLIDFFSFRPNQIRYYKHKVVKRFESDSLNTIIPQTKHILS